MKKRIYINDKISFFEASDNPLSADIGIVCGNSFIWLFDSGCGNSSLEAINSLSGNKNLIISHFHPDHMANALNVNTSSLYVGANTYKYLKCGSIVEKDLFFDDGVKIHIFPFASTHAKGSLAMEVNEEYVFLGDAIYPGTKNGKRAYNAGFLREQIKSLKEIKAHSVLLSHRMNTCKPKDELINELETILL